MNWELLRERVSQYYTPQSIESVYSIIPSDCGCSRIDERIDIDEVLCGGCSSLLREQQQRCYTLSLSTESYESDITPYVPDELLLSLSRESTKIYRTSNPLLQKFVCGSVFSSITGRESNVEGLWECNHSSFLKEKKFISFVSEEFPKLKPKKIFTEVVRIFDELSGCDFFISEPSVDSIIIFNGEDISIAVDEKSFITSSGMRSIFSINKFNVFSSFEVLPTSTEVNIPKGCDSYKSKECAAKISSKIALAPAFKLTDELLFYQRELGYPLFASQVSIYSILLSFYTLPSVTSFFENNKVYSKIWEGMFSVDEYPEIMRELRLLTELKSHSFGSVLSIMKKIHLRSDIVEYLLDKIQ